MADEVVVVVRDSLGRVSRNPEQSTVRAVVENLSSGQHAVASLGGHSELESSLLYAQVWLRPEGFYQLEYRDGAPSRHWRSFTVSIDKAAGFLVDWCMHEPRYVQEFQWENNGHWFVD